MERTFYLVTGVMVSAFFGFFALWAGPDAEVDTGLYVFCLVGLAVGAVLLFIWAVATAMVLAIRETGLDRTGARTIRRPADLRRAVDPVDR
jgi:hypothetical protein